MRGKTEGRAWQRYTTRPIDLREFDVKPSRVYRYPHNAMMEDENVSLFAKDFQALLERTRQVRVRLAPSAVRPAMLAADG